MILSTQVVDNKNDEEDSSSDGSIKDEGLNELKNIINNVGRTFFECKLVKPFKLFNCCEAEDKNNIFYYYNQNEKFIKDHLGMVVKPDVSDFDSDNDANGNLINNTFEQKFPLDIVNKYKYNGLNEKIIVNGVQDKMSDNEYLLLKHNKKKKIIKKEMIYDSDEEKKEEVVQINNNNAQEQNNAEENNDNNNNNNNIDNEDFDDENNEDNVTASLNDEDESNDSKENKNDNNNNNNQNLIDNNNENSNINEGKNGED